MCSIAPVLASSPRGQFKVASCRRCRVLWLERFAQGFRNRLRYGVGRFFCETLRDLSRVVQDIARRLKAISPPVLKVDRRSHSYDLPGHEFFFVGEGESNSKAAFTCLREKAWLFCADFVHAATVAIRPIICHGSLVIGAFARVRTPKRNSDQQWGDRVRTTRAAPWHTPATW
jgi:hypothetical protein